MTWPAAGTATARLPASVRLAVPASVRPALQAADPADAGGNNAAMAAVPAGSVQAGSLPVWAGPAAESSREATVAAAAAAPAAVRVTMASRQAAAAAGISGVVFSLARADGKTAAARVHVSLDYASFAYADGGDYAAWLHLVELPACALTTPSMPRCRAQAPVASADDVANDHLGGNVTLATGTAPGAVTSDGAAAL